MTRTCHVHIGMHKSGSTAIQTAFDGYDDGRTKMLQVGHPNHSLYMLTLFATAEVRENAGKRIGVEKDKLDAYADGLRASITAQFNGSDADFVISGEELSASLRLDEVRKVKTFLSAWFDDIRIIVYLRDPATYMRSAFQEVAKKTATAFDFNRAKPNYRKRIADWIEVFGRSNVSPVLYDRKAFAQGSVIHDFAQRIGADASRAKPQIGNESLKAEGFALTYAIRNTLAEGRVSRLRQARLQADLFVSALYGQVEFDFAGAAYERALDEQKDHIAWAEDLLKQPFPAPRRPENAVVFTSHDDIMRYAEQCRADFGRWKRQRFSSSRRLRYFWRALRGKKA